MVLETSFIPDIIKGLLGWIVILPVIYLTGSFCKSWINEHDERMEGNIFFALGLGIFGTLVNVLSFWHLYTPIGIMSLAGLIFALRLKYLGGFFSWTHRLIEFPVMFLRTSPLFGAIFLFTVVFSFCFALLPEITNDALTYQLNISKEFVWQKSTMPLIYDFNSYTPTLMNVLYGIGLMFKSMAMAKLFHWFAGYVFIISIFSVSFKASGNRLVAFWLSLLCFLTPTLLNEITSTYVDGAVCLFILLCFYLFHRGLHEFENKKNYFMAGLLLGFAVSTKIIMLLAVPTLLIGTVFLCSHRKSAKLLFQICIYFACGFAVATAYWFVRNAILTGNPLFPYMGNLFGGRDYGFIGQFQNMGEPKSFINYLTLFYDMTFKPQYFDLGYPLGLYLLIALPFSLYGTFKKREYSYQIFFIMLFVSFWYLFFHNIRFLIPVFFLLIPSVAHGIKEFLAFEKQKRGWRIVLTTLIFLAIIALHFFYFIYHYRLQFKPFIGAIDRPAYIGYVERSYELASWIENHLPENAKLLNAEENRGFYINRPTVRETWFAQATDYKKLSTSKIVELLKTNGFTHVIRAFGWDPNEDANHLPELEQVLSDKRYARLLVKIDSENGREKKYRYKIFELL